MGMAIAGCRTGLKLAGSRALLVGNNKNERESAMLQDDLAPTTGSGGNLTEISPPKVLRDLVGAAGVRFNGDSPWDIQVHDRVVYQRILTKGSLGFGEAYMDGQWDVGPKNYAVYFDTVSGL